MEIRLLKPNDAENYRTIRLEALKNNPEAFSSSYEEEKEYLLESFENRLSFQHVFTFGAFEKMLLVGTVTLICETKMKIKHRANIVAMYVCAGLRESGIGRALMEEAIGKARELVEIEQLHLTVMATNEPAKKLYKSLGFTTYGVDKKGLKIGDTYFDEELMVLGLSSSKEN
ncbi:acetyltransferase [Bacillus sp. LL01]|uniref:GNAT family N-acetyltransferase n=1 Tax=Bacillus sp. LL01 TaxID=1665556 RepID=UPI00064D4A7B|nr:GNAT family N-acetyltransferase [Bacillus sp. LL01]KMJ57415.1 acetyltransferase [Bacillus sp. LL01]